MAYGQGMLLDSIRNMLNRRQQARAEDDQFQLAQDRGENAMERLKMQADMSVAKAQAQKEDDLNKEIIRYYGKLHPAMVGADARKYGADQGIERARVTGEGFNKSAETRGKYDLAGRNVTAQSLIERQRLADEAKGARQDDQQGFLGPQWHLNRESDEYQAWLRAQASQNNTNALVNWRRSSIEPQLKSIDAEIGRIQNNMTRIRDTRVENMRADLRSQRDEVKKEAQLAEAEAEATGQGPSRLKLLQEMKKELLRMNGISVDEGSIQRGGEGSTSSPNARPPNFGKP